MDGSIVVVQGKDGEGSVFQGGEVRTPTSSLYFPCYPSYFAVRVEVGELQFAGKAKFARKFPVFGNLYACAGAATGIY